MNDHAAYAYHIVGGAPETPLLWMAALLGQTKVVTELVEAGAALEEQGRLKHPRMPYSTALQAAASYGEHAVVKILLESGADVHAQSPAGSTALGFAARSGCELSVELLLQYEGLGTPTDTDGRNALHIAAMCGHEYIVGILLRHGFDDRARDKHGYTAHDLAWTNGRVQRLLAALEETRQSKLSFAMGLHERLGGGCAASSSQEGVEASPVHLLSPEMLQLVLSYV